MSSSSPIRVVHVITDLQTGGAERFLSILAPALIRTGVDTSVIALSGEGGFAPELRAAGVMVRELKVRKGAPDPRGLFRLLSSLRTIRPSVVHSWMYHSDLVATAAHALGAKWKLAWNIRCSTVRFDRYPALTRGTVWMLARLSRAPDVVVTNSRVAIAAHETLGYRPRQWKVIPNAVDVERFVARPELRDVLRSDLGIGADRLAVGMVARFDAMKDHSTFLRAVSILRRRDPRVIGVLIGPGYEHSNSELSSAIEELELQEHIRLAGPRNDVDKLMNALDVFALCSFGEGFPNALAEAMASGIPSVATAVGDVMNILPEPELGFPIGDAEAAADRIQLALTDRQRYAVIGRQRIIEHYGLDSVASEYASLYQQLAGRPRH